MKPVIALIGRPNVGKSTLFNKLTRSRDALVADVPGLTRDRQYGDGEYHDKSFIVIDTGGIGENDDGIDRPMTAQTLLAVEEADIILFLVDGRAGMVGADEMITRQIRSIDTPKFLIVNKIDGIDPDVALGDFYTLGFEHMLPVAASQNRGISQMMEYVLEDIPEPEEEIDLEKESRIRVAVIGRPNVGKSTLINRIMGEERVVVYDHAGTTRDSIYIPFDRLGKEYTLIDTAGVRRRGKVRQVIEKFSIIKTIQAIKDAHVVILMVDAQDGLVEQDLHLLGMVLDEGRSLVIAFNKWDGLETDTKEGIKEKIHRRLQFVKFAQVHFISALHGSGVGNLFASIDKAYESAFQKLSASRLTKVLTDAVSDHQPPMAKGRRIKLRYAHMGGTNPPFIIIHGNQTGAVPDSYKRYLENVFRNYLDIEGTPVKVEFRSGDNPFEGRRTNLTPLQIHKRKLAMKRNKKP